MVEDRGRDFPGLLVTFWAPITALCKAYGDGSRRLRFMHGVRPGRGPENETREGLIGAAVIDIDLLRRPSSATTTDCGWSITVGALVLVIAIATLYVDRFPLYG